MNKEWFSDYKEQISLNNMQEARNVILDNIDKTQMIYRYSRGLNRDLRNLENHQLWLSSAFNFNDPYDCLVTVDCGLKASYPKSQRKEATRLIDFTMDINVALFFACCENIEKDAAIFIWSYSPYDPKWTRIKIQCELVNVKKQRISVSEYAEILLQKYPELKDNYTYKKDFYTDLVSYLDHGFMIMQPRNPYLENMRIQRQKGCLYVCGVKFETPIDKMRTSVNAGNNILCPNEPEAPKELDGGNFLVKVVIPARLKNVIMKQLEEKGITKEALLPM